MIARAAVQREGRRQRRHGRGALVRLAELACVEQVVGVGAGVEQESSLRRRRRC